MRLKAFNYLISLVVFAFAMTLSLKSVAEEAATEHKATSKTEQASEHKAEHKSEHGGEEHKAPLFPQPVKDPQKVLHLGSPELQEPAFMAKVTGTTTSLKWKSVEGADYYKVQVATDANFKWLVSEELMYKGTQYEVKGLAAGKHYYWRIFAGKSTNDPGYTKSAPAKSMFETN